VSKSDRVKVRGYGGDGHASSMVHPDDRCRRKSTKPFCARRIVQFRVVGATFFPQTFVPPWASGGRSSSRWWWACWPVSRWKPSCITSCGAGAAQCAGTRRPLAGR